MKDILSYDEMKEKLEKIEIPNSVIDTVNSGLEKLVSTDCRAVGIGIGNEPYEIKDRYVLSLISKIESRGYYAWAGTSQLWIQLKRSKDDCKENDSEKEESQEQPETESTERPLKKSKTFWQHVKHNYLWYVTFFVIPVVVCSLNNSARGLMVALTINLWLILCLYFCYDRK
ncbi:hypothetical protein [Limosilactobacillus reuteri]|uniref:hypothetical protein n=1 Tax=Limosilactobacillus reuteri TaxID=1598 RepID=UPI00104B78B7|nr:hypothetical protein [Limosilactobacillus reuteri]